jgi:hypothetical protein
MHPAYNYLFSQGQIRGSVEHVRGGERDAIRLLCKRTSVHQPVMLLLLVVPFPVL